MFCMTQSIFQLISNHNMYNNVYILEVAQKRQVFF